MDRRAGQLAVGQRRCRTRGAPDHHPLQEFGADLVAEAARAAVDHHDDVALRRPKPRQSRRRQIRGHFLHFEVMVAAAQRAHLVALALFGLLRHVARLGVQHLAVLLDALEVGRRAPAALDRPLRAAASASRPSPARSGGWRRCCPRPAGMRVIQRVGQLAAAPRGCRRARARCAGSARRRRCRSPRRRPTPRRPRRRRTPPRRRSESRSPSAHRASRRKRRRCPAASRR